MRLIPVPAPASTTPAKAPASSTPVERLGWTAAVILCAAYVVLVIRLTPFPLDDYPNHLTRGVVIADLLFHHGAHFGQLFDFQFRLMPYILHDMVLTTSVELFGITGGAAVFSILVLLSFPAAVLFYMHVNDLVPRAWPFVLLVGLYLSTDWFFLMGFMAYRLALAMVIVSLALADVLRARWSVPLFAAYVAVLAAGYLIHLTALVFFAAALGVSALLRLWFKTTTRTREIYLLVPVAALFAFHFGIVLEAHGADGPSAYSFEWGDLNQKLKSLQGEFYRFGGRAAKAMMILLAACLVWPVLRALHWRRLARPAVLEHLVLAATFLVIYVALPRTYSDSTYVDVRALPMISLFLILACLHLQPENSLGRAFCTLPVLALAALLATINLGYLAAHGERDNAWMARYRAVVASIPRSSYVLPVYTQPHASIFPYLHLDSFVVLDRDGVIPYIFSADRGDPMKYFHYRHPPYMPRHWWYKARQQWNSERRAGAAGREHGRWDIDLLPLDWNRVACEYEFLLVTVPFDGDFIRVPTTTVAMNESAALLAVDKRRCLRESPVEIITERR